MRKPAHIACFPIGAEALFHTFRCSSARIIGSLFCTVDFKQQTLFQLSPIHPKRRGINYRHGEVGNRICRKRFSVQKQPDVKNTLFFRRNPQFAGKCTPVCFRQFYGDTGDFFPLLPIGNDRLQSGIFRHSGGNVERVGFPFPDDALVDKSFSGHVDPFLRTGGSIGDEDFIHFPKRMEPVPFLQCERMFAFLKIKTSDSRSGFSDGIVSAVDPALHLADSRRDRKHIPAGLRNGKIIFESAQQTGFVIRFDFPAEISCFSDQIRKFALSFKTIKLRRPAFHHRRRSNKRNRRRESCTQNKRKRKIHKKLPCWKTLFIFETR